MALTPDQERVLARRADQLLAQEARTAKQLADADAIAAKGAALAARAAPLVQPVLDAAAACDAALQAVYRTAAFRSAQAEVRAKHAALATANKTGVNVAAAQSAYDAAIAARDALTAKAHGDYEAERLKHEAAIETDARAADAEIAALKAAL